MTTVDLFIPGLITDTSFVKEDKVLTTTQSRSYGNKYENLIKVRDFIRGIDGVEVPFAAAVSTEEVVELLQKQKSPFFDYWEKLGKLSREQTPEQFLASKEVEELIALTQQEIINVLKKEPWGMLWGLPSRPYWMIRSSGAEDGKVAAAGFNLSLSYITQSEINRRLGEVPASYIDKRALQGLLSRNIPIFQQLHLAVFVQEQIGEEDGVIPISVVGFTNEPLYVQGQKFRVMRLSATFGHGEGVVSNQGIATDTILVLKGRTEKLYIVYNNQPKPERLAPVAGALQPVANPEDLIHKQALSESMIERLFSLGEKLEGLFDGSAVDKELVIKGEKIYVVQARPVNRSLSVPRYLDIENRAEAITKMKVVVPGHYTAFSIKNPQEFLCIDNLEDAQNGTHKLVVITQDEPANSHPVVNFSEKETPCFYSPEEISPPSPEEPFFICPQQGVLGKGVAFEMKEGYIEHPAPIVFSSTALPKVAPQGVDDVLAIISKVKAAQTTEAALQALEQLQPMIVQFEKKVRRAKAFSHQAQQLLVLVKRTFAELQAAFSDSQRLEILFYAKAIQVLMVETPFSVLSLSCVLDNTIAYEESLEGRAALATELMIPTLTPAVHQAWQEFLKEIEPYEEKAQLQQQLDLLGELRPLWLTFYFNSKRARAANAKELLHLLVQEIDAPSMAFVQTIPRLIPRGSAKLLAFFSSQEFIDGFTNSRPLAKLMALNAMFKNFNLYDGLLKAIKVEARKPLELRIKAFKEAYAPYYHFMTMLARKFIRKDAFHFPVGDLDRYLEQLQTAFTQIMKAPEEAEQLQPSADFAVLAAMLGSGTNFARHLPRTLEDLFTLAHQNGNACISLLYKASLPALEEVTLPSAVKFTVGRLEQFSGIQHIGIEQIEDELIFRYNIPLRNHSSTCQLKYKAGKLSLSVQMLGDGRDRWPDTYQFLQLLNKLDVRPAQKIIRKATLVDVTWPLDKPTEVINACQIMTVMHQASFRGGNAVFHPYLAGLMTEELLKDKEAALVDYLFKAPNAEKIRFFVNAMHDIVPKRPVDVHLWKIVEHALALNIQSIREPVLTYLHLVAASRHTIDYPKVCKLAMQFRAESDAISLFTTLVHAGYVEGYEEITKVATEIGPTGDSMRLLEALVKQGHAYSETKVFIQQIFQAATLHAPSPFGCIRQLVRKNQLSWGEAIGYAKQFCHSSDAQWWGDIARLMHDVIESNQETAEVLEVIEVLSTHQAVHAVLAGSIELLITKKKVTKQFVIPVIASCAKGFYDDQMRAFSLFKALLACDQGDEEVFALIDHFTDKMGMAEEVCRLLRTWVNNGGGYEQMHRTAKKFCSHNLYQPAATLMAILAHHGHFVSDALALARELDKITEYKLEAVYLLAIVAQNGSCNAEVLQEALSLMCRADKEARRQQISAVLQLIIDKGYGYQEIANSALQLLQAGRSDGPEWLSQTTRMYDACALLSAIVKKGHCHQQARDAVQAVSTFGEDLVTKSQDIVRALAGQEQETSSADTSPDSSLWAVLKGVQDQNIVDDALYHFKIKEGLWGLW